MARMVTPPRTGMRWLRLSRWLRCRLVSYASVAAITMELFSEKAVSSPASDPLPFVAAARGSRLSDCWDSAEIVGGSPLRVILIDTPPAGQPEGTSTVLYRN